MVNILWADVVCVHCENFVSLAIEFKYGESLQYEYHIGDELIWGGGSDDIGVRSASCVIVDGAATPCPHCNLYGDYEIFVINNNIDSVKAPARMYDFSKKTYIVLDERGADAKHA